MKVQDVKKFGVIGCGSIGTTIAAAVATKYPVVVKELNEELAAIGLKKVKGCFPALVKRNAITEVQQEIAISRVSMTTELKDLKDCQIIVDAVPDIMELKISNFAELNKICPADTVFTTTASLLSVNAMAYGSGRPDRFVGTHFNNPAHIMALVEIAPAIETSKEVTDFIITFMKEGLGKTTVLTKASPGYIVDYIFFPFLVRAIEAIEIGLGTVEDIDNAIKLGLAHRMGPFELMDMFGNDSNVAGFQAMYEQFHDVRYAPPPTLVKLYEAGYLGQKVGKGWYIYDEKGKRVKPTDLNEIKR